MKCPTSLIHVRQDQKRHYAKYSMKNINRIVKVNIQPVTYQLLLVGEKIEFILPINRSIFFHKKKTSCTKLSLMYPMDKITRKKTFFLKLSQKFGRTNILFEKTPYCP